jgi:hypothetical protein
MELASFKPNKQDDLTLRRLRSGLLESGEVTFALWWEQAPRLWPILRDASLRDAPQDEVLLMH